MHILTPQERSIPIKILDITHPTGNVSTCTHIYRCKYIYICTDVYIYVCIYIYIYIYSPHWSELSQTPAMAEVSAPRACMSVMVDECPINDAARPT